MKSRYLAVDELRELRQRLNEARQKWTSGDLIAHYRHVGDELAVELGLTMVSPRPRLWRRSPNGGWMP